MKTVEINKMLDVTLENFERENYLSAGEIILEIVHEFRDAVKERIKDISDLFLIRRTVDTTLSIIHLKGKLSDSTFSIVNDYACKVKSQILELEQGCV